MDIVNDIRELSPKKNERIIADIVGNGIFREYAITFIGRTCVKLRRVEKPLDITAKIFMKRSCQNHEFWRDSTNLLHFRMIRSEQ